MFSLSFSDVMQAIKGSLVSPQMDYLQPLTLVTLLWQSFEKCIQHINTNPLAACDMP